MLSSAKWLKRRPSRRGGISMSSDDQVDLVSSLPKLRVEALHKETREELAKADSKATTLMSVVGLILGAFLAGTIAGRLSPQRLGDSVEWMFWIGVGFALVAEAALCFAVLPRTNPRLPKESLRYFAHVAQFESRDGFNSALLEVGDEYERLVDQVYDLSKTVVRKYGLIRLGLLTLAVGVLCCMASVLLSHYLYR
jgi:MFS family permease